MALYEFCNLPYLRSDSFSFLSVSLAYNPLDLWSNDQEKVLFPQEIAPFQLWSDDF